MASVGIGCMLVLERKLRLGQAPSYVCLPGIGSLGLAQIRVYTGPG